MTSPSWILSPSSSSFITPPSITSTHSQQTEASELEDSLFKKEEEGGRGRGGEREREREREGERKKERVLLMHTYHYVITLPGGVSLAQPFLEKETQI